MITPDQFRDNICAYIRKWWPPHRIWDDPTHTGRLYGDFEQFDLVDIQQALKALRSEGGQQAPSPAKLIERVERVTIARHGGLPSEQINWASVCRERKAHHWGIIDEVTDIDVQSRELANRAEELVGHPIGSRLAKCSRCGMQAVFSPGRLLTAAELGARADAGHEVEVAR